MQRARAIVLLAAIALLASPWAFGDTFSTNGSCVGSSANATISGNGGLPVSAGATISYSGGFVTVTLTNCFINPTSVSQNISDIYFTITGSSGKATGGQIGSLATTSLINVASGGSSTTSTGSVLWNLIVSGDTFHLTDLIGNSPVTPTSTILGAPDGSGLYSDANGSIAGNKAHNPFINQTATWTFACDGCSGAIGSVDISFGTTNSTPGTPVPEPASLILFGSGLLGVGRVLRRKWSA
jgi:PEP-CTERM motif